MSRLLDSQCMLLAVVAAVVACNNKGTFLSGPQGTLAVGAYHRLTYGDACGGGGNGKLPMPSVCSSEYVTEVLDLSSSDPSVVEIIAGADDPRGASVQHPNSVVGRKTGQSILRFKGRFSDGSIRQASTSVRVKSPDSVKLVATCDAGTNVLAILGAQDGFELEIYADTEKLVGWLPDAATADGVTQKHDDWEGNPYAWQAPATPVVLQLQSALVSKVTGTLTAFGPDQVTGIALDSSYDGIVRAAFTQPDDFLVGTGVLVNGQAPCHTLPAELHSSTPAVCSGPAGETAWAGDDSDAGKVAVHAEGVCALGVSMPGGPVLTTKSLPIFFVSAGPSGLATPGFGTGCTVEGGTACTSGYDQFGLCKSGYWVEKPFCPADQVCDFVPDTTSGCVAGTVCAQCRGLR